MNIKEKLEKAKSLYEKIGVKDINLKYIRDDEIKADYIWVDNSRGPGGIIVADNGEILFCQSIKPYQFYKEEFKKRVRSKNI